MKQDSAIKFPRPLSASGTASRFLPRALAVILDITLEEAARGLEDGELGPNLYLAIHECVHFWQFACSSFGMIRTEFELLHQGWVVLHIIDEGRRCGHVSLPVNVKKSSAYADAERFLVQTDGWDGFDVSIVSPSPGLRANQLTKGSASAPPTWLLPLNDSSDLLQLPIGTRTLLESAAEVIGRTGLTRQQAIERQKALMPYSRAAFPYSSSYWHYSAAHLYFATVLRDHDLSRHERDGLFLDVVDLALLLSGSNGDADVISPGHRFLRLTQAAKVVLATHSNTSRDDLVRGIFAEAGYGEHRQVCNEILERKSEFMSGLAGAVYSHLGPVWGQLYAYFERAMKLRLDEPTAFGSALLTSSGLQRLFSVLPPAIIFYRDNWWPASRWWVRPDDQYFLAQGRGMIPALSNVFLASISDQAGRQDFVQCPLRALQVGTPCGCDFERTGLPTRVPTTHQLSGYCHFLAIWKQLECGMPLPSSAVSQRRDRQ
jgi:hypothetical protein